MAARFLADYGMLLILAALCALLSVFTIGEQHPGGAVAAQQLADRILTETPTGASVAVIAGEGADDEAFTATLRERMAGADRVIALHVNGQPRDGAQALAKAAQAGVKIDVVAVTKPVGDWPIFVDFDRKYPPSAGAMLLRPTSYYWPDFLKISNLLNVANQIAVIAIMAIGMTMVIIAGGIDLSVGSLLALSAVLTTFLIREYAGARDASALGMILCCAAAIVACSCVGLATGLLVTTFRVPAFIITLGVMEMARGAAGKLTAGQTVHEVPNSFVWLGRESAFGIVPIAVVLMLVLYVLAHLLMAQTVLGRYIYAVGGNREAARLSGVPVQLVTVSVYVFAAALAGLGGVITASQLKSGGPNYGEKYELDVIAAVVVGGTSLTGGEGKIFGTLIGAFLIAVIHNGMNLLGLGPFDQQIVLGAVIILAALFDSIKHLGWRLWSR